MELHWGFFKDSWLIDPVPANFPITFEEHPTGFVINPKKLTVFFGANPTYVWGEGKLYHETLFANLGFVIMPFFYDRPGYEFLEKFSVSINEDTDWLGNPSTIYKVGRVNLKDMIKAHIKKFYGVGNLVDKVTFKKGDPSTDLVKADDDAIKALYTPKLTPIFSSTDELVDNTSVVWFSTMHSRGDSIYEAVTKSYWNVETPFDKIYFQQGIYENVLTLKNARLDITNQIAESCESADGLTVCFKLPSGFVSGTLMDYGYTATSGFRIDVLPAGVDVYINGKKYHAAYNFSFKQNNAVWIHVHYEDGVYVHINKESIYIRDLELKNIIPTENAPGYISGLSLSNKYVNTGNIEELGIFKGQVDDEVMLSYLAFDPIVPNSKTTSTTDDEIPVILNDYTFSVPAAIMIPNTYQSSQTNTKVIPFEKLYIGDTNSNIEEGKYESVSKFDGVKIYIPENFNFYDTVGHPDAGLDGSTLNCFMIKKLTSDTHIPLRIDMEFKMPDWWTKDMTLNMKLKLVPVDKMVWYHYKKYKTGEWN